jgi:hypothetical protein
LWKQHLASGSKIDGVYQIAGDVCGLHATGPMTPYLSLFARSRTFLKEHLEDELYVRKTLGKIRCMRGALHILTKEMVPIAYAATRMMMQKGLRNFLEFRGVSASEYEELWQINYCNKDHAKTIRSLANKSIKKHKVDNYDKMLSFRKRERTNTRSLL